jgi:hypothetical protein
VKSLGTKAAAAGVFRKQIPGIENIFYISGNKSKKAVSNNLARGKRG